MIKVLRSIDITAVKQGSWFDCSLLVFWGGKRLHLSYNINVVDASSIFATILVAVTGCTHKGRRTWVKV